MLGKGVLSMRYPNGRTIKDIPTEKVSSDFADHVRKILLDTHTDVTDHTLNSRETRLLEHLLHRTGIKPHDATARNKNELETFLIMLSESQGGNNNAQLRKDMMDLGNDLVSKHVISRRKLLELLE